MEYAFSLWDFRLRASANTPLDGRLSALDSPKLGLYLYGYYTQEHEREA
jgi:hypothetical protein